MRTTLDLNPYLLATARERAAQEGTSLTAVVNEALAAYLAPRPLPAKPYKFRWKTHGGGLLPGVDLSDWKKFIEYLDEVE